MRRLAALAATVAVAIPATSASATTTTAVLEAREAKQRRTLHRWEGTLRFFTRHPWLGKHGNPRNQQTARRELHRARIWVPILRRELGETRAALEQARRPTIGHLSAWLCIHAGEGAWNSNTGNGYFGGLQMDWSFMRAYGSDFLARWGTADRWPVWAQLAAAERAFQAGRGFSPWPNTARACGLL